MNENRKIERLKKDNEEYIKNKNEIDQLISKFKNTSQFEIYTYEYNYIFKIINRRLYGKSELIRNFVLINTKDLRQEEINIITKILKGKIEEIERKKLKNEVKEIENKVKASMAVEGLKPSKAGEQITNNYLNKEISSNEAIKKIKNNYGVSK